MKKYQKGITIIEIILYFGLLSIFLTSIVGIFTSSLSLKMESESTSSIYQDQRYIVAKLNYEITNTDDINDILGSLVFDSGKLYLNNISLNSNETVIDNYSQQLVGNVGGKPTIQIVFDINSVNEEDGINRTQHVQTTLGTR